MKFRISAGLFALALTAAMPAEAGIYTDDLTRCLVSSANQDDQMVFVRWMFSALALHPQVKQYARITPEERSDMTKKVGALFARLVMVDCRKQAGLAIKYEGNSAFERSFEVLGETASRNLFSDPNVAKGMEGLGDSFDANELKKVIEEAK